MQVTFQKSRDIHTRHRDIYTTMEQSTRRFFLDENNIIRTADQENCCEKGGIGARYYRCMQLYKDNIAQIDAESGETDKYSSLFERSVRTAVEMKRIGVAQGDVVSICSGNHLNVCVPFIAAMFLGAKTVNLDISLPSEEIRRFVDTYAPKIIFASDDAEQTLSAILRQVTTDTLLVTFGGTIFADFLLPKPNEEEDFRPLPIKSIDDVAHIFFSSGTTGLAKGVCISHKALLNQVEKLISDGQNANYLNVILYFTSMYWISSAWMITVSLSLGTTRVIAKNFDPFKTWLYIDKYKVTYAYLVTRMLVLMNNTTRPPRINTDNLRLLVTAGEYLTPDVLVRFRNNFPNTIITQGYGSTESAGVISLFRIADAEDVVLLKNKPASCGRPVAGILYKIVDINTGKCLGFNRQGELRLKSPYLMSGYHNKDQIGAFDEDGWLMTGDIVYLDEDFCFFIVGRLSEMITCKGWSVIPTVLEMIIKTHPAVDEAVVLGVPHDEEGARPLACVTLKQGHGITITEDELTVFVNERVDENNWLTGGVRFVESFVRTPTGKINRKQLKDTIITITSSQTE